jgi:hypothetical protein
MTHSEAHVGTWKILVVAALMVAVLGLVAVSAAAADDTASRLDRKVKVMERVLDEVLIQSPNVVVSARGVTRGLVLEEYGALFTLEASVGGTDMFRMVLPEVPDAPSVIMGSGDDEEIIVAPRHPDRAQREDRWLEKSAEKRAEQYKAFKSEMIDAIVDYGVTLTELKDDQWLAVVAFLDSRPLFGGDEGGRLMLKIKMRDLRQHSAGTLSRDAVVKRVIVEES